MNPTEHARRMNRRHRFSTWRAACRAAVRFAGESSCPAMRTALYLSRDGIIEAIGPLSGRNRIVADFYDGPGWVKFRPWEQAFLMLQGGVRRARMEILRHLARGRTARPLAGLEVGIGSGENLAFLPPEWTVFGVDIARTQLEACLRRHPAMARRLAWAEAESLPFADATFDACWSVGGFNYFSDHEAGPARDAPRDQTRRPGRRRRRAPRASSCRLGPLARNSVPRCLVAAQARA